MLSQKFQQSAQQVSRNTHRRVFERVAEDEVARLHEDVAVAVPVVVAEGERHLDGVGFALGAGADDGSPAGPDLGSSFFLVGWLVGAGNEGNIL